LTLKTENKVLKATQTGDLHQLTPTVVRPLEQYLDIRYRLSVGLIQLTVDDSLFASSHVMGAGIVARDSLGTFVATMGDR
jgi:hypothetical protein